MQATASVLHCSSDLVRVSSCFAVGLLIHPDMVMLEVVFFPCGD